MSKLKIFQFDLKANYVLSLSYLKNFVAKCLKDPPGPDLFQNLKKLKDFYSEISVPLFKIFYILN